MKKIILLFTVCLIAFQTASCAQISREDNERPFDPSSRTEGIIGCDGVPDAGFDVSLLAAKNYDDAFKKAVNDFSSEMFSLSLSDSENTLVSPISMMIALSLTANGAGGETLAEMEAALGLSLEELNAYFYKYMSDQPDDEKMKLAINNSVWYRDAERLSVNDLFIQKAWEIYSAEAYRKPFDSSTVGDINGWIEEKTDGLIKDVIKEINDDVVMYLINTLLFDAEWQTVYGEGSIVPGAFSAYDGTSINAAFMVSDESKCIFTNFESGIVKDYVGGKYSFMALLPNEGEDILDYAKNITGDRLSSLFGSATEYAEVTLPKFEFGYEVDGVKIMEQMGMITAFDSNKADFTSMATSTAGNIYISDIIHKTFIQVDENGTKAGAATVIEMSDESMPSNIVNFNRPFVFAIMDNEAGIPLFIGTVLTV